MQSNFREDKSQDYRTPTTTDLSGLTAGLTAGESMNAANMTSDKPADLMQAPSSTPVLPEGVTDNPVLAVPPVQDYRPTVS